MEINIEGKSLVVRLDNSCEQCNSYTYEIRYKKPHVGLYCKCCGKYIKWLSKSEKRQYGVITPEDVKLTGIGANAIFLDDVRKNELDKHRKDYGEGLKDEVPWYD